MQLPARIRARSDGLGPYIAGACVLVLLGVMGLLLRLQSPSDKLLWTGTKIAGSERDGLVYYQWQGQHYAIDVPGYGNKTHVSVFIDPADPDDGITDSVLRRGLDVLFTVVPIALGLGVLTLGVRRRRSATKAEPTGFGQGLDPVVVDRLLQQIRQPPP